MLKQVMLGSGGILLAAVIFAASITPGPPAAAPAPAVAQPSPVVVAATQTDAPPPAAVFPDDSGDVTFGAPMIAATPVDSGSGDGSAEPAPLDATPDSAAETAQPDG